MSDFFDLSQLLGGFKTVQPTPPPVPSLEDMAALLRAIDAEQRREHRTLFCRPELADEARAAIAAAGLSRCVDVVASSWVDEGQAYLARTPLDENGELAWWRGER